MPILTPTSRDDIAGLTRNLLFNQTAVRRTGGLLSNHSSLAVLTGLTSNLLYNLHKECFDTADAFLPGAVIAGLTRNLLSEKTVILKATVHSLMILGAIQMKLKELSLKIGFHPRTFSILIFDLELNIPGIKTFNGKSVICIVSGCFWGVTLRVGLSAPIFLPLCQKGFLLQSLTRPTTRQ